MMSITSSNNSSENLTPDELATIGNLTNSQLACCTKLANNGINLKSSRHNSYPYPLYENSNFSSANHIPNTENLIKKNFTTILEVPRSTQSNSQLTANRIITSLSNNVSNNNQGLNAISNNLPNGLQHYSINNQLNNNLLSNNLLNNLNPIDHYANLPPPKIFSQATTDKSKQFNSPLTNNDSTFTNSIYALQQQSNANSSNNSSNNNICVLGSQSSIASRSCLTTPDSNEQLSVLSKSQPDLNNLENELNFINATTNCALANRHSVNANQIISQLNGSTHLVNGNKLDTNEIELLKVENDYLRIKLNDFIKKITKLQKLEMEVQKVSQIEHMYEELMLSAEKKEKLERAARYKLEIEIKRLHQQNKQLKDQLTIALSNSSKDDKENDFKKEDTPKVDFLLLLTQNKELINTKEKQEIELQAQRLTLGEQRNHIEILDNALMSAQNNVVALENSLRKKMAYEERANNLQKALNNLQLSSERRLQMEKRARTALEKEIESLKNNNQKQNSNSPTNSNENELEKLRKLIREYEDKIHQLESEVNRWEQKYVEENTMRQIEVNAASLPKDAKIAALEKTSQKSEKIIAEARFERLRHMDELHEASKQKEQLESAIKDLESKLAEKEAMIKVLQQQHLDRDLQQSILAQRSNLNNIKHTRSASSMGFLNGNSSQNSSLLTRNLKNLSISGCSTSTINRYSDLTSSNSSSSRTSGYSTQSSSSTGSSKVVENNLIKTNSNMIDEQSSLKELDKRLNNKNSIIRALRTNMI